MREFYLLSNKIEEIATNYFLCLSKLKHFHHKLAENVSLEYEKQYVEKVNTAYIKLNERNRKIINNEFFFENYPYWWESKYSSSYFSRIKKEAMRQFLNFFQEECI